MFILPLMPRHTKESVFNACSYDVEGVTVVSL